MSQVVDDLKFSQTHEWVRLGNEQTIVVGITDHAQHLLGDIVFVELPEVGAQVQAGHELAVVESVKAAADVYSPVSGEVVEINDALTDTPAVINQDPYQEGWLCKIRITDTNEVDALLSAADYKKLVSEQEEA
ncbi:MAG: glycine cleavage system protein GcvH [Legionellales bacterium]|nr:glycine cleavage system protein GcvH [Legionellales bacterium]